MLGIVAQLAFLRFRYEFKELALFTFLKREISLSA